VIAAACIVGILGRERILAAQTHGTVIWNGTTARIVVVQREDLAFATNAGGIIEGLSSTASVIGAVGAVGVVGVVGAYG